MTAENSSAREDADPGLLPRREALEHAPNSRTIWDWVQLAGLLLLAAGVAVLVAFALTVGGR